MKCFVDGQPWAGSALAQLYLEDAHRYFILLDFEEIPELDFLVNISDRIMRDCLTVKVSKFESHEGFDYFLVNVPDREDLEASPELFCAFFSQRIFVLITGKKSVAEELTAYVEKGEKVEDNQQILLYFLEHLTAGDSEFLQAVEDEIEALEDEVTIGGGQDCIREINLLRKRLMRCKNYYEQLYEILFQLCENTNELLDKKHVRLYQNVKSRVDRMYRNVLNLREYVTHIRESYQAQLDIAANKTMQLFTILTAIFAPLTLLVGWYGMNLAMPEFGWRLGYPFVAVIAVIMLGGSIALCKWKKWF